MLKDKDKPKDITPSQKMQEDLEPIDE